MDRELYREIAILLAPLKRKLALVATHAVVKLVRDGLGMQGVQVTAFDEADDYEHRQPGGLSHNPPSGAEGVLLTIAGVRDDGVVIAVSSRAHRPKSLNEGDTALYSASDTPARIFVRANGDIEVIAAAGRKVRMSSSGNPSQAFLRGTAFVAAFKTWLEAHDIYIKIPTPDGTATGAYETASEAFVQVLNNAVLSTVIEGE